MARYGWRPRDFLVTPGAFGRFEEVQWRPLSGNPRLNEALPTEREEREAVLAARREVDRQRAARWQHSVAFQVRSGAPYRGLTLEDIAVDSRIGLDSLRPPPPGRRPHGGRGLRHHAAPPGSSPVRGALRRATARWDRDRTGVAGLTHSARRLSSCASMITASPASPALRRSAFGECLTLWAKAEVFLTSPRNSSWACPGSRSSM